MNRFYIIRHGEKLRTPGDPPLSNIGNIQAQKTAKHLQQFPINNILASPILRTQQTAKHIADLLGLEVETNHLLRERVNWGDEPNQSFEDFIQMWIRSNKDRHWQPPVGDSSLNSGRRLEKAIQDFSEKNDNSHTVLVTHGGIITDFLRNAFDNNVLGNFITDFQSTLDNNIKECSITIVEADINNSNLKLIQLANRQHLIS